MTEKVSAQSTALSSVTDADDQFEKRIIKEIKKYPCLYDINHIDYRSEQLKKFAWITISNDLDKTIRECLDKWYFALQHFWHDYRLEKDGCRTKKHWSSYETMKEMVSYLADKSYGQKLFKSPFIDSKPTKRQYQMLISYLVLNRSNFYVPDSSIEDCQKIWSQVAEKLNSLSKGCSIPVVKWQRYWKNAKRNVGKLQPFLEEKLKSDSRSIDLPRYSTEELDILEFCNVSPTDSADVISAALLNDFELGRRFLTSPLGLLLPPGLDFTTYMASHPNNCRRCPAVYDGPQRGYCEVCAVVPRTKCDMCRKDYDHELKIYPIAQWAKMGKELVSKMYNYNELTICLPCMEPLNRKATEMWKVCRFCEVSDRSLEYLYSSNLKHLLEMFMEVTKKTFNETDGLPGYICKVCKMQMQHINNFYLKFSQAQSHLEETHIMKFIEEKTLITADKSKDRNQSPAPLSSESIANVPGENDSDQPSSVRTYSRRRLNEEDTENEPPSKQRCDHDLPKLPSNVTFDINSVKTEIIDPFCSDPETARARCKNPVRMPTAFVNGDEGSSQPMQDNVEGSNNDPIVKIKTEIVDPSYADMPSIKEEDTSDDDYMVLPMIEIKKEIKLESDAELEGVQSNEPHQMEMPMEIAYEEVVETTVEFTSNADDAHPMEAPEINAGEENVDKGTNPMETPGFVGGEEISYGLTLITAPQIIASDENAEQANANETPEISTGEKVDEPRPRETPAFVAGEQNAYEAIPMTPQIMALDLTTEQTNPIETARINAGEQKNDKPTLMITLQIVAGNRNVEEPIPMETPKINAGEDNANEPRPVKTREFVAGKQNANKPIPMTTPQITALDLTAEQTNRIETPRINAGEEKDVKPTRMATLQIIASDGNAKKSSPTPLPRIIEDKEKVVLTNELKSTLEQP